MIEKALKYVVGLKEAKEHVIGDITYTDKDLFPVFAPKATALKMYTLTSLVEYIKRNTDSVAKSGDFAAIVHIENHALVSIKSQFDDGSKCRDCFVQAIAEVPSFEFGGYYNAENFNTALQSKFIESQDRDIILKVVGNLKDSAVRTIGDDGVSQSVTTKTGIATVADVKVPNPVSLRPYRTFLEIEQPESEFVFRMKEGGNCALFEADGGAWKNEARISIKKYLENKLFDEVSTGKLIILA